MFLFWCVINYHIITNVFCSVFVLNRFSVFVPFCELKCRAKPYSSCVGLEINEQSLEMVSVSDVYLTFVNLLVVYLESGP